MDVTLGPLTIAACPKCSGLRTGRFSTPEYKAKVAARMKAYKQRCMKDPLKRLKINARHRVRAALKSGKLVRGICLCGSLDTQAHHKDYTKPLDVDWLCCKCHRAEHKK